MTKDELKDGIIAAGGTFNPRDNKATLEDIYYGLTDAGIGNQTERPIVKEFESDEKTGETIEASADGEAKPEGSEDTFDELLGKVKSAEIPIDGKKREKPLFESTRQRAKRGKTSPDTMQIEGYILLLVIDTVYPAALAMVNNMLDKKLKIQAHQLSLKPEQWKALEPLADQAAAYLAINLNPIAGFILISTFMYGNNLIAVRMEVSNEKK